MNPKFLPFSMDADRLISDGSVRLCILAAAIGRAIANAQPLPSSQVENPTNFYLNQVAPQARDLVSVWNENLILNTKETLEYVREFWNLRYHAAHPNSRPTYVGQYGFFDTISGMPMYFSDDDHKFLNQYKDVILTLSSLASFRIADMMEANSDA